MNANLLTRDTIWKNTDEVDGTRVDNGGDDRDGRHEAGGGDKVGDRCKF